MNPPAKVRVVVYWTTFVLGVVVGATKAAFTTLGSEPQWFQVAQSVWGYLIAAVATLAAVNVPSTPAPRRALEEPAQVVGNDAPMEVWAAPAEDSTTPQARLGFRKDTSA